MRLYPQVEAAGNPEGAAGREAGFRPDGFGILRKSLRGIDCRRRRATDLTVRFILIVFRAPSLRQNLVFLLLDVMPDTQ